MFLHWLAGEVSRMTTGNCRDTWISYSALRWQKRIAMQSSSVLSSKCYNAVFPMVWGTTVSVEGRIQGCVNFKLIVLLCALQVTCQSWSTGCGCWTRQILVLKFSFRKRGSMFWSLPVKFTFNAAWMTFKSGQSAYVFIDQVWTEYVQGSLSISFLSFDVWQVGWIAAFSCFAV